MAVTHILTGGSDPEPKPSEGIRCLHDRRCRGAAKAQEQDQMVNRWGDEEAHKNLRFYLIVAFV